MAVPQNIFQTVSTYQESNLGFLLNQCCFLDNANKKFNNFQDLDANLGATVTYDLPPRFTSVQGLVISTQPLTQRVQTLSVTQAANTSYDITNQQYIFNVESYMEYFGEGAMKELANQVEIDLAKNCNSSVRAQDAAPGVTAGQLMTDSGPYRFFGNGNANVINNYQALAQIQANYKIFGSPMKNLKVFLPTDIIPTIIGTGLNQFSPRRNDEIANSWELGSFGSPVVQYYESNLLPTQIAGTVGESQQTLTVVSTNDPTGKNITQITFSGATASDVDAIKSGDLLQFQDGVGSLPNLRFRTFIGHAVTRLPVQFRATADAEANGSGNVTISFLPALCSENGNANQNINVNVQVGMQVLAMKSHVCGLMTGGDAFYVSMPRLPDEDPYKTIVTTDNDTGASMRMYKGSLFGQNQRAYVNDVIWGSHLVPEYSMRLLFPLT